METNFAKEVKIGDLRIGGKHRIAISNASNFSMPVPTLFDFQSRACPTLKACKM